MDLLTSLNPEQKKAVQHVHGPLLILAGAGSGKTRVIVHRLAHLIGSGEARPDEVLAVTFTNKAAEEMRTRVESLVGADCSGAWISTFHAFCARVLRRDAPALGLSRDFVIYDSSDQLTAVKQVMRELKVDDGVVQPRAVLSHISSAKNKMETPEQVSGRALYPRDELVGKIYAGYRKALADANALDFDDLLLRAVDLMCQPEAGARWARRFRFVMVDEYQDTNRPQYLLIKRLALQHQNLCVVGDPDQSIYRWRGADIRNILDFETDFPSAEVVRLERNYRSTQIILDAASAVIRQNENRKEKRLWTDRKGGDKIVYFQAGDELEEADFISRTARRALRDRPQEIVAILYRTNSQSRVIEDAFRREGLPYRIIGGVRFYERKEVKDALAYLKLVLNPYDDVSFRRIVNVPTRGVGKAVIDALERVPIEDNTPLLAVAGEVPPVANSLWTRLERGLAENRFSTRAAASLKAFRELIVSLAAMVRRESVSIALAKVLDQSGYLTDLREDHSEESQGRVENLAELVSAAREYESREAEPTLASFVDRLSLLSDADEEAGSREARVLMMTLHSAKGLEFPTVAIAGMEEGLFPHSRSADDGNELEEERRLCYVGMTRARSRLFLTCAARRRVFGEYRNAQPSRFIDEVPPTLVEQAPSGVLTFHQRAFAGYDVRPNPYGSHRGGHGGGRVREEAPVFAYESEDQSRAEFGPGTRVKHPQFGLGTVLTIEELDNDVKLTVRFSSVGQKRLLAKYAKLERA